MNFPVKGPKKSLPYEIIGIGIVINQFGQVLIDQRLNEGLLGGMWEFPGGKKEADELITKTIERELKEELNIKVEVLQLLISFDHSYSHKKLKFIVHICNLIEGEPQPIQCQKVLWVYPNEFNKYPFPAANVKIIDALINHFKSNKSM